MRKNKKTKVFIAKNKEIGDKKAFSIIKKQILSKPNSLIGLATGKTTDNLYKLISRDVIKNPKKWSKIKLFQIDENLGVSPDSPLSFNHEIKRELKSLIKVTKEKNIFLMDGTKSPQKTIKDAYRFIRLNKGIDLIILGLGPEFDPHIAYNTTGKSTLNSRMRVVDLHPKVARKIERDNHGKPLNRKGITIGIKDILETRKALLIAYGKDKAKSLEILLNGKVNMKNASASALQLHKDLNVVTDKAALRL